jgi:predicted MFS family arabinose efflux permease
LRTAISQNELGANTAASIGPSIGGFIYQFFGKTIPYLFDSVSYLISVISLLFIKENFQSNEVREYRHIHLEIIDGISWLWNHKTIRLLALLTGSGALAGAAQSLLIILMAQKMNASAFTIGLIFSMSSIGGILGAIFARTFSHKLEFKKTIKSCRWAIAISYSLLFFAINPILLGIFAAVYWAIGPIQASVQASYRISLIPPELQGRVNSSFRIILYAGATSGSLIAGVLSQSIGVTYTLLCMCILLFSLAIIATRSKSFN